MFQKPLIMFRITEFWENFEERMISYLFKNVWTKKVMDIV